MAFIMLFEQWLAEEGTSANQPVAPVAQPNQATALASVQPSGSAGTAGSSGSAGTPGEEVITIIPDGDDSQKFTVNAIRQQATPNGVENSFMVNSSSNASIKKGATLMISTKSDHSGMSDIVAANDPNNLSDSVNWSGKVTIG